MLLHDDVVAHGKAKSSAFAGRLSSEERIEYLFFYLGNASAVAADTDFHRIAETLRRSQQCWLESCLTFAISLSGGTEPIRDQIKKRARDLLWKQFG
jgi:hypothetical protein